MVLEKTIGDAVEFIAANPKLYTYTFAAVAAVLLPVYNSCKKWKKERDEFKLMCEITRWDYL